MSLDGKCAFITGAASGIGQGVAVRTAARGAHVVCADIQDASVTVKMIQEAGGSAEPVLIDVSSAQDWTEAVSAVVGRTGRLDLLANVAGITPGASGSAGDTVLNLDEATWSRVLDINLKSVWLGMKAVIPHMREAGVGRIVNTSSISALRGMPGMAAYAASKGGIQALTQQAAAEYAADGILVNAIAPGMILTPVKLSNVDIFQEVAAEKHLVPRLGEATEVGDVVVFLFDEATFMTGQVLPVDGGWTARG
ncbi:SDR family oxidoreductase [Amycolatopsis sp. K13G38]|uniref:SDR family oxidoreductase n=1 Tax=Amycolatopsis acididurans TaxID=2724524 RepID=A0ABX1JB24_9PSEU|nr:SDR family NAD(P)-dependent oxidoreductase [Amycolatopsis acididurans]NKQ56094.1 SDR family oxidoreductase [Amycolatopsis acididurans]